MNTGLTATRVYALAINPTTPTTLYAGTYGGGVFQSTNAGGSWSAVNTGLTNTLVQALAINPTTPTTLYAGTFGGGVLDTRRQVGSFCTSNGDCPSSNCVDGICCDPSCIGTCQSCALARTALPNGTCAPVGVGLQTSNNCNTGSLACNGNTGAGSCTTLTAQGQACTSSSQCMTGNCVDGICCGPTCSDTCQSCAVAETGLVNGTCGSVSVGLQTSNGCNTAGASCNGGTGAGSCLIPTPTVTPTSTSTPTVTPTPTATLAAGCPSVPDNTCFSAGKSSVSFKDNTDTTKRKFSWKWSKGAVQLVQAAFGDPVNGSTSYKLCVYDETASLPVFKLGATLTPGGMCGTKPCWKAVSDKGWAYKNKLGNGDGITKTQLKGGDAGKPQVQVQAKGTTLPMPAPISGTEFFDQDPAVIVQLHSSSSANCWSSTFDSFKKNDGTQFKAVSP